MFRRVHGLLLLLAVSSGAAPNPWLDKARTAYATLDCDQVLADLALAKEVPTNDAATRLSIFDYAGRCHVALGQRAEAEAAFAQMLELDPQAELDPALSPKIRDAFKATKLKRFTATYVAWKEQAAEPDLRRAELVDPWKRVTEVVAGRWDDSAQKFAEEKLSPNGRVYVAQVRARGWFIEARGEGGASLALLGSRDAPPPLAAPRLVEGGPLQEQTKPAPADSGKKGRNIFGATSIAVGAAAAVTGVVLWSVAGATREKAVAAEWADEASTLEQSANTQRGVGHAVFWPGLLVAGVGIALSF